MPTCCVKNCTSRTHDNGIKGLKYFSFPNNVTLREQWLKACQKKETDMKIDSGNKGMYGSLHFDKDCFEWVKTQPRSKNTSVKEILKLKKESVPSKMLFLEKKRKRMLQSKEDNERVKVLTKFHLPTYKESVQYAHENQLSDKDKNLETNVTNREREM
ncbi:hypothetical protein ALC57_16067 [Trachymyrmex cornetzi]|uniref:THAP-type domain-containing protein n=1 Tax=Trachymyrmex cornetzi TaxID=471704 RepID=A0A151IVL1_9HYME|nr:hypothetical protein ALC57_16067 [Trachymyrmex cornetzi]